MFFPFFLVPVRYICRIYDEAMSRKNVRDVEQLIILKSYHDRFVYSVKSLLNANESVEAMNMTAIEDKVSEDEIYEGNTLSRTEGQGSQQLVNTEWTNSDEEMDEH